MKKTFYLSKPLSIMLFVLLLFLSTFANGYASAYNADNSETRLISHKETFTISNNKTANFRLTLYSENDSSFNRVQMVVDIYDSSDSLIYHHTYSPEYNSNLDAFYISDSVNLNSTGVYSMKSRYKCYSGSRLIKTIIGSTKIASC